METLFDLPSHILFVHAPIVLLPLVALATVVVAFNTSWRRRARWWIAGAVGAVVVMVFLARRSGEALDDALEGAVDAGTHQDLANTTSVLTLLWFAAVLGLALWEQLASPSQAAPGAEGRGVGVVSGHGALAGVAAVLAILATVWLVRTGHEGSRLVWEPTVDLYFR